MNKKIILIIGISSIIVTLVLILLFIGASRKITNPQSNFDEIYIYKDPTKEDPLQGIGRTFSIPAKENIDVLIGYYNLLETTAEDVTIIIDECKDSSTGVMISYEDVGAYPVYVLSLIKDVPSLTIAEFEVTMTNNILNADETYICKLKAVQESNPSNEYASKTFFLEIGES